jgi:hypothetical protein
VGALERGVYGALALRVAFAQARAMQRTGPACAIHVLGCVFILASCGQEDVESVSTDVCASGKRWAGNTGNEEMYPGHDCVGCHRYGDGPALLAGGTVYGIIDETGQRTTLHDCFGVEGARVTITASDGTVLQTLTNRAGNFYFEGREESLVTPFSVVVDYTFPDGRVSREPMATHPSYGGCGRCHNPLSRPTTDAGAGEEFLDPFEVVAGVYPIYTGPVHE